MWRFIPVILLLTISAKPQNGNAFFRLQLEPDSAGFSVFAIDGLGKGSFEGQISDLLSPAVSPAESSSWSVHLQDNTLEIVNRYERSKTAAPFQLTFDAHRMQATVLGYVQAGRVPLPALLHLPNAGDLRISSGKPASISYNASRSGHPFVQIQFPAATAGAPEIRYRLQAIAIYPALTGIESDPRLDSFRRNYLNILQMNARLGVLANNSESDPCPFVLYQYAAVAAQTPLLAEGLRAIDLVRLTLDKYIAGFIGYGMPGFRMFDSPANAPPDSARFPHLDVYPSLLIAAWQYVQATSDMKWLEQNYAALQRWQTQMLAMDRDGDGLLEYPLSGNSHSWSNKLTDRPANWWDTIGFGHKDAYSNALAFQALEDMSDLAHRLGRQADATAARDAASRLKRAYYPAFYDAETGVLAGWRSADGQLHDYYFPWVNGIAIVNHLVTLEQGRSLMAHLLAKMRAVGFTRFDLGLPGNLVPIHRGDYVHLEHRWGGPTREDGADGFQIYENGGATGCFAYFTIRALQLLGQQAEANRILDAMLVSYDRGGFSGRGSNGMTYDWKTWTGEPNGYEGFLVDNYLPLLAVAQRYRAPTADSHP